MESETILITGGMGQIGSELVEKLRLIYGKNNIISTDIRNDFKDENGIFEYLDVLDKKRLNEIISHYNITTIYHLAALLSGTAEKNPLLAWEINTLSLLNILNVAKDYKLKIFFPSSIAVFGNDAQKEFTPQNERQNPSTVYGISKMAGEQWCNYYYNQFNVDVRSLRFPGLISWKTKAGGGTTDYAVNIFYDAIVKKTYECFITKNTLLPMLYIDDAINGMIQLMRTDKERINIRTSYNIGGLQISPKILADEITKYIPEFTITYNPDFRQKIAESWPIFMDDTLAKKDWNWNIKFTLDAIVKEMLTQLKEKLNYKN